MNDVFHVYVVLVVGLLVMGFLDTYTTYILVGYGFREANPFVDYLMQRLDWISLFIVKDVGTIPVFIAIIYIANRLLKKHGAEELRTKCLLAIVLVILFVRSLAVLWNMAWLINVSLH